MRNFSYILPSLILLLTLTSCSDALPPIHNQNNGQIEALGHGGMGVRSLSYPFNSWESIEACFKNGAAGTELDVQLTADSQLVVFHDELLETNTDDAGRVVDHTLADLMGLEYQFFSLSSFSVTSLEQVLTQTDQKLILMLDCKTFPGEQDQAAYLQRFAKALEEVHASYKDQVRLIVESINPDLLLAVQRLNPDLPLFLQVWDLEKGKRAVIDRNFQGVSVSLRIANQAFVQSIHEAGLQVAIFGVTTRQKNRASIQLHPDYIQTDRIEHLVHLLDEKSL